MAKRAFYVLRRVLSGHRIIHMRRNSLDDLPPVVVPNGYALRTLRNGDAAGWVHVVNRAMNPVWSERRFHREVESAAGFRPEDLHVMTHGSTVVGTASAWRDGSIHIVAVLPEHRGHGLGKVLTLAALHRLRELGFNDATLITDGSRSAAIHLYKKLGFEEYPPD